MNTARKICAREIKELASRRIQDRSAVRTDTREGAPLEKRWWPGLKEHDAGRFHGPYARVAMYAKLGPPPGRKLLACSSTPKVLCQLRTAATLGLRDDEACRPLGIGGALDDLYDREAAACSRQSSQAWCRTSRQEPLAA